MRGSMDKSPGSKGGFLCSWESLLLDFRSVLHGDAAFQSLCDGTAAFENGYGAFGFFALTLGNLQVVFDPEMRQLQDAFGGVDGALRFGPEFVGVTRYPTRFQRAGESAGESAGGGCDEVVEGRRQLFLRSHLVEVSDCGVNAEVDGFLETGEVRLTLRAFLLDDFHLRDIDCFAHFEPPDNGIGYLDQGPDTNFSPHPPFSPKERGK